MTCLFVVSNHSAVAKFYEKGSNNNLNGDQSGPVKILFWNKSELQCSGSSVANKLATKKSLSKSHS